MRTRVLQRPADVLRAEIEAALKSSKDAEFAHRVTMVSLMLNGMTPKELSEHTSYASSTLSWWFRVADKEGLEALRTKDYPGRPPRLTTDEKRQLAEIIAKGKPEEEGYGVWDGPSVSDYISKAFGKTLQVRQCQRLLRQMGFSLVRPQASPVPNSDPVKRENFKKNSRKS